MESLPSDIVLDIISRVPAESVLECKLVCKRWETLASGSNFANMHLTRQLNQLYCGDDGSDNIAAKVEPCLFFACRIDDPDVYRTLLFNGGQLSDRINSIDEKYIYSQNLERIYHPPMHEKPYNHLVGSCNGLVCAFQHHHLVIDPIYICNPLTREYVYLPQLVVNLEDLDPELFCVQEGRASMYNHITCGFGYVRSTNEYKVVRIHYLGVEEGNVEVYTLGSGCGWRAIGEIPYRLDPSSSVGMGVCVNDAIYWTMYNKVVAFDLAKEEFRMLPDPPCMENRRVGLVALGRHLCIYTYTLRLEIWSLMESRESKETWRLEFDIDYKAVVGTRQRYFKPILLTKNGDIIFLYDKSVLYCYDTKTTVLKIISNEASTDHFEAVEAIAHLNTFVSLEAIGENSKRYTVRPRRVRTPWDDVIDELDRVALGDEIDITRFRFRSSMESLPLDIVQDILSRVPAEFVLECKLVCKKWVTLIRGSNFATMHLSNQLNHLYSREDDNETLAAKVETCLFFACWIDDPNVYRALLFHGGQVSDGKKYIYNQNLRRIYHPPMHNESLDDHLVGSCNGLVCAFQHHHTMIDPIYICNPLTREYVHLPELVLKEEDVDPEIIVDGKIDMYNRIASGFGYVRSTNEYKVVRIHYLKYGNPEGNIEVYTLGSGAGWRAIGGVSHRLEDTGTYVNDAIYWTSGNNVVAFDLVDEEFRLLCVPPCMQNFQYGNRRGLVALGRHLCLYTDNKVRVEIWSLMKSSDLKETWRMEFDIDYRAIVGSPEVSFRPIFLSENGKIIFLYDDSMLYSYDTRTTILKLISNEASTDSFEGVEAIAHVNSLVALEAMGENSKRYTVRARRVRTPWDDVIDELDRVALGEKIDTTRFRLR